MKRNNKKGFTIVELVIVIAVIAILSAVLIPTFGSVINDANTTARDQEARNIYTSYLTDCVQSNPPADPAQEAYIKVVQGEGANAKTYYYTITGGELSLTESETEPTVPSGKTWTVSTVNTSVYEAK